MDIPGCYPSPRVHDRWRKQAARGGPAAPDFNLPSTEDRDISLADFKGKQAVVLYFYPRDDTPGCTAEACSFRDLRSLFNEHGAEILGVSTDTVSRTRSSRPSST